MKLKKIFNTTLIIFLGLSTLTSAFASMNSSLEGTWSSVCAKGKDNHYVRETLKFSGNSVIHSINNYADPGCYNPRSSLITFRTFKLGAPVAGLANTRKIDYVVHSVTMTYKDPSMIAPANASPGYYGFTNWKINQPKEISNLKRTINSNRAERAKGEKIFAIVKVDKNKLYIEDYNSGSRTSEATRSTAICKIPFKKE